MCESLFEAQLILKDNAKPRFFKPRQTPFTLHDKVKFELKRLVKINIIKPVKYSKWASPIAVVLNPINAGRIFGDFKVTLNSQLCTEEYFIPNIE